MHNTPALFHTEPLGNPAADVGMFLIDKLFTNVVQALSAIIFEPTIIVLSHELVLLQTPPKIEEQLPDAIFVKPPLIDERFPDDKLKHPPPIAEL